MQKRLLVLAIGISLGIGWSNAARAEDNPLKALQDYQKNYDKLDPCQKAEIAIQSCEAFKTKAGSFVLTNTIIKKNSVSPDWHLSVESGKMTMTNPFGRAECSWNTEDIAFIRDDGLDIHMKVIANNSAENTTFSAGMKIVQGFGPNSELGKNILEVTADPQKTATDESTVHINPHLPNEFLKEGDKIYVDVSCDAGTVTYEFGYFR